MDSKILEQIKENLLKQKADLEQKLASISDQGEAAYEDIGDDEDVNAQEVSEYSDRLSLVAEFQKSLEDINKSLEKIQEDDYGICKYCKKEINPERLLARPSSGACIKCKAILQGETN